MNTTSHPMSFLARPEDEVDVSTYTLAYASEAARDQAFDFIVRAMMESGLSKATLAKRLGKDPSQVTRILQAPSNWTLDTMSELLFAIDGRMLSVDGYWPLDAQSSNKRFASCFESKTDMVTIRLETTIANEFAHSMASTVLADDRIVKKVHAWK